MSPATSGAMRHSGPQLHAPVRFRSRLLALLVAMGGLLLTAAVYLRAKANAEEANQADFSRRVADAALRLDGQLRGFEEALHASAGYVMGSEVVTALEWQRFEGTLRVPTLLPGVTSMAFARTVRGPTADSLVFRVIDSETPGPTGHPNPLEKPGAMDAVRRACTSGDVASILWKDRASGVTDVALVRLIYRETPRYPEPRCLQKVDGVVFIEFRPSVLAGLLTEDGEHQAQFDLLPEAQRDIDRGTSNFFEARPVRLGGQRWYLEARSLPHFEQDHTPHFPLYVLLGGLLTTGLASTLTAAESERRRLEAEARQAMERTLARTETALDQSTARSLEAEQRFSTLIDSALDAIISVDDSGQIILFNPAAERLLRCRAEEVIGQPLTTFLPGHMQDRYKLAISQMVRGARQQLLGRDGEMIGRRHDGEEFPFEGTLSLAEQGGRRQYVLIVRDLSERRAIEQDRNTLEAQLRQSQKMEAIGTLAGGIAHDFNNILGSILGNAEMAMEELSEPHPAREFVGEVVRAGKRAGDLVRQILSFTRLQDQERKPVRLDGTATEVVHLLRATLPARIELIAEFAPSIPTVLADPGQIHQVLLNLITNSVHAIGDNTGVIRLILRRCPAGSDPSLPRSLSVRDCLELAVSDSGCGMSPAVLDRIFDPFYTTKPVGQGTGLGLSVAHGIVLQHEGLIRASSIPGRGTTVQVLLPVLEEEPAVVVPTPVPLRKGSGGCVLLVDDEEALRTMGDRLLQRLGYTPLVAASGGEALRILEEGRQVDILLTDYNMPGLSGTDLAARALKTHPHLPIVLLTGYGLTASPENLKQHGIRAVLSKPVAMGALAETLAAVSERNA